MYYDWEIEEMEKRDTLTFVMNTSDSNHSHDGMALETQKTWPVMASIHLTIIQSDVTFAMNTLFSGAQDSFLISCLASHLAIHPSVVEKPTFQYQKIIL